MSKEVNPAAGALPADDRLDPERHPRGGTAAPLFAMRQLEEGIERARKALLSRQNEAGYWVFDLEADCTIPSEYVMLQRFLGREIDPGLKDGFRRYLLNQQLADGGWPLFAEGAPDISATVKAYFALKLLGESPEAPHMARARRRIHYLGGAARVNVFTRIALALFGEIPWRTVPAMPIEIMHLPKWFFFHLDKVSYWSRTVVVPLLILCSQKPVCRLTPAEGVRELFLQDPDTLGELDPFTFGRLRKNAFLLLDRILKRVDRFFPAASRAAATAKALAWTRARMQGEGGLGAIYPAMANAVMALHVLGYPEDDPDFVRGLQAIDDLLLRRGDEALCQPCVSPIWDTCLTTSALTEAGVPGDDPALRKAVQWLFDNQIFTPGDWCQRAPGLEPGGWAFQFENALYPDVDDTPMVLMAMLRAGVDQDPAHHERLFKAVRWVVGMQNSDGGWGAFDVDNDYLYLNDIPFADHGALLDPSTSDLTGRCIELLGVLGYDRTFPPIARALAFLEKEQEANGSWFGRWGVNYIYGTWSVLCGLARIGIGMESPMVQRGVAWLKSVQNADHGWGESCYSYHDPALAGKGGSTPSQTAWALLGLMAAGEVDSAAVQKGVAYLLKNLDGEGQWSEEFWTGTGFPRVFYLKYHGYAQFFPLWALGVYRRLRKDGRSREMAASRTSPPEFLRELRGSQ